MCVNTASCNSAPAAIVGRVFAGSTAMLDLIMLAMGLAFFVLAIGYAYACDRL